MKHKQPDLWFLINTHKFEISSNHKNISIIKFKQDTYHPITYHLTIIDIGRNKRIRYASNCKEINIILIKKQKIKT